MKLEKNLYAFYLEGNEHSHPTIFWRNEKDEMFTENIERAAKAVNKFTAKEMLRHYEDSYDTGKINNGTSNYRNPERELKILPVKITYEW